MGSAYFYHLTDSPLEATLPMLLGKAMEAGWRVVVRGTSDERLDWLDQKLWLLGDESFLPHGLAGGRHDAAQPILLTRDGTLANAPACVMAIDGAEIDPAEAREMERVCILFDGHDPGAVEAARGQWKALTDAGISGQYWAQQDGRWVKKAESGSA